jgi:hypothetical protein
MNVASVAYDEYAQENLIDIHHDPNDVWPLVELTIDHKADAVQLKFNDAKVQKKVAVNRTVMGEEEKRGCTPRITHTKMATMMPFLKYL